MQRRIVGWYKEIEREYYKCALCIENKMHNVPFKNNRARAKEVLEIIHTDVNGPHRTVGSRGEKYFMSVIDDHSRLCKVYCIRSKEEVYDCLCEYINEVENITGMKVKKIRCDNGKEYLNSRIYQFTRSKEIQINACPPYVHELNGVAERFNRTIMDMARCLMAEAKVNRSFWPECIKTAAYLKNRSLANTEERKTPYELFFRKRPDVKNLRIYGSKVYVRIPEEKRISKWDKKAERGVLLGYTDVEYRVLINNRVVVARHVDIIEEHVKYICFNENEDEEEESDTNR